MDIYYIWATLVSITIILAGVGYLAWRDTKISYEIKDLDNKFDR